QGRDAVQHRCIAYGPAIHPPIAIATADAAAADTRLGIRHVAQSSGLGGLPRIARRHIASLVLLRWLVRHISPSPPPGTTICPTPGALSRCYKPMCTAQSMPEGMRGRRDRERGQAACLSRGGAVFLSK